MAAAWLRTGCNKLPPDLSQQPMSADTSITALVYEFVRPEYGTGVQVENTALDHLEKAGLRKAMAGTR